MTQPLLELTDVWREYPSGDEVIAALKGVNLTINAGELVAVVGQSGSGKSTLMNILGCLDRPSRGAYRIDGRDTSELDPDDLAQLRREHFGFIFQRYHLMNDLSALDNVEVPAVYAGMGRRERRTRAQALLTRLGLGERMGHRPSQLSGGQQQRVSIARALMNGGQVILADEPTGALDSQSGADMLRLLEELSADGHTIILVTHAMHVAEHAHRIIEIKDGEIIADRANPKFAARDPAKAPAPFTQGRRSPAAFFDRFAEAARMAVLAMNAHKLRAFLTMLGIIIGIASVVSVVALGEGTKQAVLKQISAFGTNTIDVYPGKDWGDVGANRIHTLSAADADALARQSYVDSVSPVVWTDAVLRYGDISVNVSVNGVGESFFRVHDAQAVADEGQVVVIDDKTANKLFGPGGQAVGAILLVGTVPCRVVAVEAKPKANNGNGGGLNVWVPYSTVLGRMLGRSYLNQISVRLTDDAPSDVANDSIIQFLTKRHGAKDVFTFASDFIKQQVEQTTGVMTLVMSIIALIALLVGGIGVMNIMLVSVTERIKEIGVRSAVGARRGDILSQFLIEAVLVCVVGGALGVGLAYGFSAIFNKFAGDTFVMAISPSSVIVAFTFSSLIGVGFGFMPARSAARLDPVDALSRE
jgi:macrolide transport system ATP-binding/permease protein